MPSLLYYLVTLFIPLPMEYDMAVRGKQQLVKVRKEEKKMVAWLISQEDDLLKTLVKREYNVL